MRHIGACSGTKFCWLWFLLGSSQEQMAGIASMRHGHVPIRKIGWAGDVWKSMGSENIWLILIWGWVKTLVPSEPQNSW